ncbi:hypothetical protein TWF594_008754 [Orbilia oligospora]|uniref:Uncharacterized protein n=1 Tax=Orbilia oligospora TaxID=2813651 RepID=A0A7C8JQR9_ORBOL|nr:hypothetical protein TWF594_008754 [Orbilia oligospora]KAF3134877.1 hypothetical protein TWF703_006207 [Orbilia oligospora]
MQKSRGLVYSVSRLLFIFIQFLSLTLAVPCYIGTSDSLTTEPDATSAISEPCNVTESIDISSSSTTISTTISSSSRHPAKTTTLINSIIRSPTAIPLLKNNKIKPSNLSAPIKVNTTAVHSTPLKPNLNLNLSNQTTPNPSLFNRPRTEPNSPTGIYSTNGFYVDCESSQDIYENFVPHSHIPGITPEHWPDWASSDFSHEDAITTIQYEQSKCESCHCDENGLYNVPPAGHPDLRHCPDSDFLNNCIAMYGCTCHIEMKEEPPEEPFVDPTKVDDMAFIDRVTTQDFDMYQEQDQTKDLLLYSAFNRWWKNKTDKKKSHKGEGGGKGVDVAAKNLRVSQLRNYQSAERYLVPGEKEPYFLEGPNSSRDTYYWNSLSFGAVGGGSVWKRGVPPGRSGLGGDNSKTGGREGTKKDEYTEGEGEGVAAAKNKNEDKHKDKERRYQDGKTFKNGQR